MTLTKIALAAAAIAATGIGLSATAHADPEYLLFTSPPGNVKCEMTISSQGRSLRELCGPTCRLCGAGRQLRFHRFGQSANRNRPGRYAAMCPASSLLTTRRLSSRSTSSQTRSVGTITCDSEEAGVTCTDTGTVPFLPRLARVVRPGRGNRNMMREQSLDLDDHHRSGNGCGRRRLLECRCAQRLLPTTTTKASVSASAGPAATSSTAPASPASQTEAETAKPIDTIEPEGDPQSGFGGPPIRFRITLVNNGADIAKLGMVVSLGHCSCGHSCEPA